MNWDALKVVVDFALKGAEASPVSEQIKLYQALGEVLPAPRDAAAAKEIAKTLSRAAALQLELFQGEGDGQR